MKTLTFLFGAVLIAYPVAILGVGVICGLAKDEKTTRKEKGGMIHVLALMAVAFSYGLRTLILGHL